MESRSGVLLGFLGFAACILLLAPAGASAVVSGEIEGEVVDAITTDGIEGVEVCAIDPVRFEFVGCELTGPSGEYLLGGLVDGSYVVEFWARPLGYVPQYFDGVTSFSEADEVVIAGAATVSNVDAEMEQGGEIEGTVVDAATDVGIENVEVCAFGETVFGGCALTGPTGDYTILGVDTGSYLVEFWAAFAGYETLLYDGATSEASADLVSVLAPDATSGIDARLSKRPSAGGGSTVAPASPIFAPPARKPRVRKHCRKGFKRVQRHGRRVCVKRHRKRHHRRHR